VRLAGEEGGGLGMGGAAKAEQDRGGFRRLTV
jgi:hypothetical protein